MLLVHGYVCNRGIWRPFAQWLAARGHPVESVNLEPVFGTIDDYVPIVVDAVRRLRERAGGDRIAIVAHSMGGIVVTEVAGRVPSLITRLVYVTAFRPVDGESLLDLVQLPEGATDGVQANIVVEGEPPVAVFDRSKADEVFYHDVPEPVRASARERLDPQPLALFATPVSLPEPITIPTDYVICTDDGAIPPALQELMAAREPATVFRLASSHSPMFSFTAELSDILTR